MECPHIVQKRLPATTGTPHDGHPASGAPQSPQNRSPVSRGASHRPAGVEEAAAQERIGQFIAGVGQRLLSARSAVPEGACPEAGVQLGRGVEPDRPGLVLPQHEVPASPLDLTERDGGAR